MFEPEFMDDPIGAYLSEVQKVPLLTPDEELDCFRHVRAQDRYAQAAAKRLVEAHLSLVVSIAERHGPAATHLLDTIQQGNEGLIQAVRSYDESAGEDFRTYATARIESAINNMPASA